MAESSLDQKTKGLRPRPLSPHLQIYRFTLTMAMSIIHRITGVGLYFGTLLLAWWLIAAATSPEAFALVQDVMGSWIGKIVLFGFTWALINHAFGGIRHFIWDVGAGFDPHGREFWTWLTTVAAAVLTVAVWVVAYLLKPGVVL